MIYTVTFNPAIDYVMHLNSFDVGKVNRACREEVYYGGKGINVSTVLKNLGQKSVALGFVAGFSGKALETNLKNSGIATDFITLTEGITRINVKIKGECETEINGGGPHIPPEAIGRLMNKLDSLKKGDFLSLSGSVPRSVPDDMYERIGKMLWGRGVNTVIDAASELLLKTLKYEPFLIKPNVSELGEIFGETLTNPEEIWECAEELKKMGARNVLVSMAGDGSLLVSEKGDIISMDAPKGTAVNSVGAGDSMVAGFILGYMRSGSYTEAVKLGTACGSATAFSPGLGEKELIEELYGKL